MNLLIIFEPEHYPRTMTRGEWQVEYRRYREACRRSKEASENFRRHWGMITDARIRDEILDRMINPPICIWPDISQAS